MIQIIKIYLDLEPSTPTIIKMIDAYSLEGNIDDSIKLFNLLDTPNIHAHSGYIRSLMMKKNYKEVINTIKKLQKNLNYGSRNSS